MAFPSLDDCRLAYSLRRPGGMAHGNSGHTGVLMTWRINPSVNLNNTNGVSCV